MAFNKVTLDACRSAPVREHDTLHSTCHLGTEALAYLKQLVFQLGDYDSNTMKMIYSFGLVLQQKCRVNLIYENVFNKGETWSLTLQEERKLRVFENMVLRRIFVPRRDEVMGEWRRLHNEELNDLYSSPNIVQVIESRRMRWAGHVAHMGEERGGV